MNRFHANEFRGDNKSDYLFSVRGSHHPEIVNPYLAVLGNHFLSSYEESTCGVVTLAVAIIN